MMSSNAQKLAEWIANNPPPNSDGEKSKDLFVWTLWLIHAPHDLQYFEEIVSQFQSVLSCWKYLDPRADLLQDEDKSNIEAVVDLLAHLFNHQDEIQEYIPAPKHNAFFISNRHPMHSKLGIYYVYAAMISSLKDGSSAYEDTHNYIKSVVLMCHYCLKLRDGNTHEDYLSIDASAAYQDGKEKSRTNNACRFIRQSCYMENSTYLEEQELKDFKPIRKLYEYIQSTKGKDRTHFESTFSPLISLVVKEDETGSSGARGKGGRGRYNFTGWNGGYVRSAVGFYKEDITLDDESIVEIITPSEMETEDELAADLIADENAPSEEVIFYDDDNPRSRGVIQKSQVKHIAVANQMLPFAWGVTTVFELTDLLKNIGEVFQKDTKTEEKEAEDKTGSLREALLVLLVMLVTGEKLRNVVSGFRFQNPDKHSVFSPNKIYYVRGSNSNVGLWRIYPQLAKQNRQHLLKPDQRNLCGKKEDFIELPDILNFGGYIRKVFTESQLNNLYRTKVFKRSFKTYEKIISQFIERNCQPGNRINIERVRSVLFNIVVTQITGDTADGTLITGKYHFLSKTKLHYTTLEISQLQELYTRALKLMTDQVHLQGYDKPSFQYREYTPREGVFIGSAYNPRIESVIEGVFELVKNLSSRAKPTSNEAIIEYHNIYTLYVVLFIGFSTGYRAIKDPFPEAPNIDEETGLCVISDKDGADFYNSRLVWLPEILIEQLDKYREHRRVIRSYLLNNNENLEHLSGLPELFFLDENFKIEIVRPLTLTPKLKPILDLPVNTNRRFLRSYLKTNGCPTEIIDAFMGHWSRGEEPWGEYSTISYLLIIQELKKYIPPLLNTLGFKVIRSRVYDA